MIKQAAFEGERKLLKGGLHCHTTRSDGRGMPEDVMKMHKENGYDFLAITDHRVYNFCNFAPETGMLIIPGMEIDQNLPAEAGIHCYHTVVLGREKKDGNPYEQGQQFSSGRVSGQEEFQKILDEYHNNGQMTLYCHPEWSNTPARDFEKLEGNFAMEVWNSGCVYENGLDTNAAYWDEILGQGKRIYGCAVDDGHQMHHHCLGWVHVNAEKNVDSVLNALKNGAFYSSCGPEIKDFYINDEGRAVVECSPVADIAFRSWGSPCRRAFSDGDTLTRLEGAVPKGAKYIRVTVMDSKGRRAWSNPIFLDQQ